VVDGGRDWSERASEEQQRQRGNEANEKAARPPLVLDPHKNDPTLKAQSAACLSGVRET